MTTDRPVIREIISKAVCGKGTLKYHRSIDLDTPYEHKAIQVLGNFVSNAALDETRVIDIKGKIVRVRGHYDVHVWYAYGQETCAAKTTVTFVENVPIKMYGGECISNQQAFADITQKPRCLKAYVVNSGNKSVIKVEIEQDISAEVIGMTKLKVGIVPTALVTAEPIIGQELLPPNPKVSNAINPVGNYYLDLKVDEDLPDDEDDEDYEYDQDEYDG